MLNARALCFAIVFGGVACGRGDVATVPRTLAEELRGTWSESVPLLGIANVVTLQVSDTTISGTGTYAIEAGQPGTIIVSGVITGATVNFDMARSNGWTGHFRGTLSTAGRLTGISWYESAWSHGDPAPASFQRTGP